MVSTGEQVAIKIIELEETSNVEQVQREITFLAQCDCENITRYFNSFIKDSQLLIVMEYCNGGSVMDLLNLGPIPEAEVAIIMREVLQGLNYLHSEQKIHRDIKAANILLSATGEVKLADFGVSSHLISASKRFTVVGTPYWMAPEVIAGGSGYDLSADVWSLGITAIECAHGKVPRIHESPLQVLATLLRRPPPRLSQESGYSKYFHAFVDMCLRKRPKDRPTPDKMLQFPFIRRARKTSALIPRIKTYRKWRSANPIQQRLDQTGSMSAATEIGDWDLDTIQKVSTLKPTFSEANLFALKCKLCNQQIRVEDLDTHSKHCDAGEMLLNSSSSKHSSGSKSTGSKQTKANKKRVTPTARRKPVGNKLSKSTDVIPSVPDDPDQVAKIMAAKKRRRRSSDNKRSRMKKANSKKSVKNTTRKKNVSNFVTEDTDSDVERALEKRRRSRHRSGHSAGNSRTQSDTKSGSGETKSGKSSDSINSRGRTADTQRSKRRRGKSRSRSRNRSGMGMGRKDKSPKKEPQQAQIFLDMELGDNMVKAINVAQKNIDEHNLILQLEHLKDGIRAVESIRPGMFHSLLKQALNTGQS